MPDYEEDFTNEELIDFEIEGRKFGYKPTTAGEENDWIQEYMKLDPSGRLETDMTALNKCKTRNLFKVPYTKTIIGKFLGMTEVPEWKDLNADQRWLVLRKLKPSMFTKIINKINEIDSGSEKKT